MTRELSVWVKRKRISQWNCTPNCLLCILPVLTVYYIICYRWIILLYEGLLN